MAAADQWMHGLMDGVRLIPRLACCERDAGSKLPSTLLTAAFPSTQSGTLQLLWLDG